MVLWARALISRIGLRVCHTCFTHWGNTRLILGLYWDNGKENGNCDSILGLSR